VEIEDIYRSTNILSCRLLFRNTLSNFDLTADTLSIAALVVGVFSIFLVLYVENERRPQIEFLETRDQPTPNDSQSGHMWYHISVRNRKPRLSFLNRDSALQCIARVEFLDVNTKQPLQVGQIEAHWTSQPEPKNYTDGNFDVGKVTACQRIDVGFREEKFDVLVKFVGQSCCFASNPWVVYRYAPNHESWNELRIEVEESLLKIEVEAINLGKTQGAYYLLSNRGTRFQDVAIKKERIKRFVTDGRN
jgi:hypothetical protein